MIYAPATAMTFVDIDDLLTHETDDRRPLDHQAVFTDAFVEHAPRLLRYISRQVTQTEAEDVLGETFCIAWQTRHRYRPQQGPLIGWLFGIATNVLRRHKRTWLRSTAAAARLPRDTTAVSDTADRVADRVDASASSRAIADVVAELEERDRDVLLLSSWGQLDHGEIALALDIPVGTVRSRLHRARQRILASLPPDATASDLPGDSHA